MKTLLFALLLHGSIAVAQTVNIGSLPPDEQAAIKEAIAQQNSPMGVSSKLRTEAMLWGDLGTNMGRATVAAAREMGIAVNEFVATPLGKITMALVVYKVIGKEVLGVFFGSIILLVGMLTTIYFLRKKNYISVEYSYHPVLWGLTQRRIIEKFQLDNEWDGIYYLCAAVSAFASLLLGLNLIF